MSSRAPPAPAARARPGPGGRVRPAADGRAGPFRFRKEQMKYNIDDRNTFRIEDGPDMIFIVVSNRMSIRVPSFHGQSNSYSYVLGTELELIN